MTDVWSIDKMTLCRNGAPVLLLLGKEDPDGIVTVRERRALREQIAWLLNLQHHQAPHGSLICDVNTFDYSGR